jgi:hypothetical protein
METLKETFEAANIKVTSYKQNGTSILCKINMTPGDAKDLCRRTPSGLYINKDLHSRVMNMIVNRLEQTLQEDINDK